MGLHGFGTSSTQQVMDLQKALTAGTAQGPGATGGSALRVESLEESLKVLTYTDRHLKLWPKIFKSPAYSTVEEYNQLDSYGNDNYGSFLREGELPTANDSSYLRKSQLIKFMGTTREITHPATLVHPAHGDLIALENQNGILWILRQVEKALFEGDSSLVFSGEGPEWDGLRSQIDSSSVLDLEGSPLQEADIEQITNTLAENYAFPTDMYLGYRPMSDFVKTFYPRHRVQLPSTSGNVGQSVTSITTQAGQIAFNPNIFLTRPDVASAAARGPAGLIPDAPTVTATLDAAATSGEFDKSQGADTARYFYRVSLANRFGESASSAASGAVTMTGAQAASGANIDVVITNAAAITNKPEYVKIYRTLALSSSAAAPTDPAQYSLVKKVKVSSQAALGTTTFADDNIVMPFTEEAYIGEMSPQVLTFRQLAPLMKIDLAVLAPSYRWMILLYGALILFAPKKWAKITNIGRLGS